MKRFFCFLLILWLAAQAGLAQAHVMAEDLHSLTHAVLAIDDQQADEYHHDEPCDLTHCWHPVGILTSLLTIHLLAPIPDTSSIAESANGRTPVNAIERPKWALATPAVASL